MTFVDLDIIHGDHLVNSSKTKSLDADHLVPINAHLLTQLSDIESIQLTNYFGHAFYQVKSKNGISYLDGLTGQLAVTISEPRIEEITRQIYAGNEEIYAIDLLPEYPSEIRAKSSPIWRVEFDDIAHSTLYFHHQTGKLISKRTDLWRVFDFLWQLHILDYLGLGGYQGLLYRIISILSLAMSAFGLCLLYYRLKLGDAQ